MKKLYLLSLAVLLSLASYAQSAAPGCATKTYKDDVNDRKDLSPDEKAALLEAFDISQTAFNKLIANSAHKAADTTLIIPVVFHVIHTYGPENIPNQTIYATINLLNREYNKLNAPSNNVVFPFTGWIGKANIEFRLATIDPDGNCTNGIIRHYDPMSYCNDLECNKAVKTKYRWPRENYMNCHIVGSIQTAGGGVTQGFSHFPFPPYSLADSIDANAMIYNILPTNLNDQGGVNTSVTSHEVGHWLGLYHTWGKTDNVALPENCTDDDDVFDTPNCVGLRSVCDLNSNTCGMGQPNDTIDNTQNFMDYSHCYAMFTQGQTDRMRGVLLNVPHRKTLATPANLIATGTNSATKPTALCAAEFTANLNYEVDEICPGSSISFSDLSFHTVTSRNWSFEGGSPATGTDSVVKVTYNQPGDYSVTLEVKDPLTTKTITKTKIIHVINPDVLGSSYSQDFETIDLSTSTDFEITNVDNDATFEVTNQAGFNSSKSLRIHNVITPARNRKDELISNTMNLTGTDVTALEFKYAYAGRPDSATADEINVYISTDCGLNWTKRKTVKATTLKTAPDSNTEFVPSASEWKLCSVALTSFKQSNVRFKIDFLSGGGNNLYLDDIRIVRPSGIEEARNIIGLDLAPNPAIEYSDLSFTLLSKQEVLISVSDLTGRIIQSVHDGFLPNGDNVIQIPTHALTAGMYLVTLHTNGSSVSKKLLIQ